MVVEDEKDVADLVKINLEKLNDNVSISIFENPISAIEALKTKSFNVIISDYHMPEINGLKFLSIIRKNNILTPFIIFTGLEQELEELAFNEGATYFIRKGPDFRQSIHEMNKFINFILNQQKRSLKEGTTGLTEPVISKSFDKTTDLELILQNIDFGLYILNLEGQIVFANRKGATDLGYDTVENLLNDRSNKDIFKVLDVYNPKYFDFLNKQFNFKSGDEIFNDELVNIPLQGPLQQEKWFLKKVTPIFSSDYLLQFVSISTYDITNLMKNEYESRRELQYGMVLNNCLDLLYVVVDEQDYMNSICKLLVEKSNYILAWIGSAEIHHNQKIVLPIAAYGFEIDYLDQIKITWDDAPTGKGPVGTAIKSGKPSIFNDIVNDKNFLLWRDDALQRGYHSCVAIPIKMGDQSGIQGSLNIYSSQKNAFLEKDFSFLSNLSRLVTAGLHIIRSGTNLLVEENFQEFPIALIDANITDFFQLSNQIRRDYIGDFREYFEKHPEVISSTIKTIMINKVNQKTIELLKIQLNEKGSNLSDIVHFKSNKTFKEIIIALHEGKKEIIRRITLKDSNGQEIDTIIKLVLESKSKRLLNHLLIAIIVV